MTWYSEDNFNGKVNNHTFMADTDHYYNIWAHISWLYCSIVIQWHYGFLLCKSKEEALNKTIFSITFKICCMLSLTISYQDISMLSCWISIYVIPFVSCYFSHLQYYTKINRVQFGTQAPISIELMHLVSLNI